MQVFTYIDVPTKTISILEYVAIPEASYNYCSTLVSNADCFDVVWHILFLFTSLLFMNKFALTFARRCIYIFKFSPTQKTHHIKVEKLRKSNFINVFQYKSIERQEPYTKHTHVVRFIPCERDAGAHTLVILYTFIHHQHTSDYKRLFFALYKFIHDNFPMKHKLALSKSLSNVTSHEMIIFNTFEVQV